MWVTSNYSCCTVDGYLEFIDVVDYLDVKKSDRLLSLISD